MSAIPISKETLKDLYGPSFFLLEGELADISEPIAEVSTVETPAEKKETKAPAVEAATDKKETKAPTVEATAVTAEKKEKAPVSSPQKPGIEWKVKPTSKVLFIISASEWSNKELLALLKKIVASLEIPFDLAGFGLINGPVQAEEFHKMPQKYGVVFDATLLPFATNPMEFGGNEVFFSHKLDDLKDSQQMKKDLWAYLKALKERIN